MLLPNIRPAGYLGKHNTLPDIRQNAKSCRTVNTTHRQSDEGEIKM